ncbi:MAG: PBP1A family penicillin-binding protein [Proteobacteria bacterium]|nr:PBP1A family penicillin-binding protein [Pseudomonadota bacterium]
MFSQIKKWIFGIGLALVLFLLFSLTYCWYLSGNIEKRFSGRKWKIPSTVYSDTTLLFPGKHVDLTFIEEKLKKLGYRKKMAQPEKKGEYQLIDTGIEIYFKDLNLPDNIREGFLAALDIDHDQINNIRLIDTDGSLSLAELGPEIIMQFFGKERELRRVVSINNIPKHLSDAVTSAEDSRFYTHFGVDPIGIIRALFTNIRYGYIRQGGSTLTQQLSKNYFLTSERTLRRKLNELFISVAIELKYSKDEIIEIYLNEIYFGQKGSVSINGVGEAADFYFGKKVENLTLSESAVIAGIIKGPNIFSPYSNLKKCTDRRNQVLHAMKNKQLISDQEMEMAITEPIKTVGFEKYNRQAPFFLDYVSQQLNELYPETSLSSLGFSIFTSLDTEVQNAAEKALENGLNRLEQAIPAIKREEPIQRLQGAVVVLQPRTGNILAMVGGRDYNLSQFNRITQSRRQPGSCIKPIIVASFLDVFKPSDLLNNEEISYLVNDKLWAPKNFGDIPEKQISVRDMLRLSCNRAAVDMVVRGGLGTVIDQINTYNFSTQFLPYPSIALGAFEVSPLELARAYCAFAADGIQPFPLSVKDVIDENGNSLVRRHMDIHEVISPAKAFLISSMLESVVTDGTAKSLVKLGIDFPLAGKTGTTNEYKDAWFIGYTPDFLALVWVGFDNGDPVYSTGSGAAIPIFAELVKSMPGYISQNTFTRPPGVVQRKVCKQSGELAVFLKCPETYDEYFLEENKPEIKCHIHASPSSIKRFFNGFKNLFK